ncbi:AI-2E family transporter [Geotalea uraniireducens]|uniref:AI-2E family transporter n=1 Tax=Geotalea uraniireducens (strain Rf4) TaxID=351605 RepID=A5GBM3_GEOUR|nr:hypothetical protein [Geotalea uraniireducens]ABQ25021.1 hypothetical protein Gura_0813 [Geotalea uraniireducens Rf4]
MTPGHPSPNIARTTLAVLFIGILTAASFWILHPFLTALVWATMIVVTTWPVMLRIQKRLRGKRALAVTAMTVGLLLVFSIPFTLAVINIIDWSDEIVTWSKSLATFTVSPPPAWVEQLPVVGPPPKVMEKESLRVPAAAQAAGLAVADVAGAVAALAALDGVKQCTTPSTRWL